MIEWLAEFGILEMFTAVQVVGIALAAFVASLISGIGGFGGGFVIAMTLTPIVGAKAVIPLLSVFAFLSNVSRVIIYRRTIDWGRTAIFLVASTPGVMVGVNFFVWVPERLLLAILGFSLIGAVPLRRSLERRGIKPGTRSMIILALIFGFVSGTAVGSGMLVVATLLSAGLTGPRLLGTDAVIGLVNSASRGWAFFRLGALNQELVVIGVLLGIMTLPGVLVARFAVDRMGLRIHTFLLEALILFGGCYFIFHATTN